MAIDDFTSVNDEIIDAIVAKKPLVRFSWIEVFLHSLSSIRITKPLFHMHILKCSKYNLLSSVSLLSQHPEIIRMAAYSIILLISCGLSLMFLHKESTRWVFIYVQKKKVKVKLGQLIKLQISCGSKSIATKMECFQRNLSKFKRINKFTRYKYKIQKDQNICLGAIPYLCLFHFFNLYLCGVH